MATIKDLSLIVVLRHAIIILILYKGDDSSFLAAKWPVECLMVEQLNKDRTSSHSQFFFFFFFFFVNQPRRMILSNTDWSPCCLTFSFLMGVYWWFYYGTSIIYRIAYDPVYVLITWKFCISHILSYVQDLFRQRYKKHSAQLWMPIFPTAAATFFNEPALKTWLLLTIVPNLKI